ncbi:hypothetical protein ACQPU1_08150 [Clostridium paraputrificum]
MSRKNVSGKFSSMAQVGNFTKGAVKSFESNLVNKKDYLEEVKAKE